MVAHAALAALLARLSGTGDIAIGTPVAGRGEQALDDLVGMFVNTLVLRTGVDPAARSPSCSPGPGGRPRAPSGTPSAVRAPRRNARPGPLDRAHPLFQVMLAFQNLAARRGGPARPHRDRTAH